MAIPGDDLARIAATISGSVRIVPGCPVPDRPRWPPFHSAEGQARDTSRAAVGRSYTATWPAAS